MTNEWDFAKSTGTCAKTGRVLIEDEPYYAVLIEHPDAFERRDYSVDGWDGPPEGCFCHWRGRMPVRKKKNAAIAIDIEMLIHIFVRLQDDESPMKQRFRFMLALLLMRKRLLKLEQKIRDGEHEYWRLRLINDQSMHQLLNPQLTNQQVACLGQQLTMLLSGDVEAIESLEQDENIPAAESEEQDICEAQTNPDITGTESEDGIATS